MSRILVSGSEEEGLLKGDAFGDLWKYLLFAPFLWWLIVAQSQYYTLSTVPQPLFLSPAVQGLLKYF